MGYGGVACDLKREAQLAPKTNLGVSGDHQPLLQRLTSAHGLYRRHLAFPLRIIWRMRSQADKNVAGRFYLLPPQRIERLTCQFNFIGTRHPDYYYLVFYWAAMNHILTSTGSLNFQTAYPGEFSIS